MNEAELILAVNEITATMLDEEAVFYTQVSAYLVVVYLAAEKLTRFQLALVNTLFVFAICISIFGVISFTDQIDRLFGFAGQSSTATGSAVYTLVIFRLVILIGALVFMWQARNPKAEQST